jgi:hypothetical protein
MTIEYTFNASILHAPRHINSNPIDLPKHFKRFNMNGKTVTAADQEDWWQTVQMSDSGWSAVVVGENPDNLRLFAHDLCDHMIHTNRRASWQRINSTRWYPPREATVYPSLVVLDAFLAYESGNSLGGLSYDIQRASNIYDIVGMYYGVTSTIVLCPGLTVEYAVKHLKIRPEFMFNLDSDKIDAQ